MPNFRLRRASTFSPLPFLLEKLVPLTSKTHSLVNMRNESTSNMTTLFACAHGVTSLFPSKFQFQEHVAFQLATVILWPSAGSSSLLSKVQDKYWRMVVQSTQWKDSFGKNCWILAKCGSPPLGLKKIADPPGDSFAYYYRPPLAEGQRGVWDLQANAAPTWGRRPRKPMLISHGF